MSENTSKFRTNLKSGLKAFGTVLQAAAEASSERAEQVRDIDRQIEVLEAQRAALTGQRRQVQNSIWSPSLPGHLISCSPSCTTRHCLDCGEKVSFSSDVRCFSCR